MKNKNTPKVNYYPSALTIAAGDSCGSSGIQADLRTFNAYAVYGCSAITAINAQNSKKLSASFDVPAKLIENQIDTILESIPLTFAKSGMLGNSDIIRTVSRCVAEHKLKLVVDPVLFDMSNKILPDENAIDTFRNELFKTAYAITANIREAEILLDCKISDERELFNAARKLSDMYNVISVIKGADLNNNKYAVDAVAFEGHIYQLRSPMLKNCRHSHGAGSTFSAAFCANMALGTEWDDALIEAKTFVFGSLAEPVRIGDTAEVMYPPETDYSEHISLLEI